MEDFFSPNPTPIEDYNVGTLHMFRDTYICTEEDLKYKFTNDQLKELCRKMKCRVMASRWNIVFEYNMWLTKEGRFVGKSERYARGMVKKGVNRHKTRISYDEDEIKRIREAEKLFNRKSSILYLRLWERERTQEEQRNQMEHQDEVEANSKISISNTNGEGIEPGSIIVRGEMDNIIFGGAVNDEAIYSLIRDDEETESQNLTVYGGEDSHNTQETFNGDPPVVSTDRIDGGDIEVQPSYTGSEEMYSQARAMFDVNTESIPLLESDAMSVLQSQSEDIFTEDFNNAISLTSTQKDSEEIKSGAKK